MPGSTEKRIDTKIDARFNDLVGVIHDLSTMTDKRLSALEDDSQMMRKILLEREDKTKEKVDMQGDLIQAAFHRIERVEDRLQLSHDLVYEKSKKRYTAEDVKSKKLV